MPTPEDKARENIDRLLTQAGWAVRDQSDATILAHRGLAIRKLNVKQRCGIVDDNHPWPPKELTQSLEQIVAADPNLRSNPECRRLMKYVERFQR